MSRGALAIKFTLADTFFTADVTAHVVYPNTLPPDTPDPAELDHGFVLKMIRSIMNKAGTLLCAQCHRYAQRFRCKRCRVAYVCSATCNAEYWETHRSFCTRAVAGPRHTTAKSKAWFRMVIGCLLASVSTMRIAGLFCLFLASGCIAHSLELETFVENELVMVKLKTFHGISRDMKLSMDGRVSTCDVASREAAFMDVAGNMLRPMFSDTGTAHCELDLFFLFQTFRQVILSHNSIVFTQDPLEGGSACMRDSTTSGLCETKANGITLRWFSDMHLFDENVSEVDALGVQLPRASWSISTPQNIVDVSEAFLVSHVDICYDRISNTIRTRARVPSLAMKIVVALLAAVVAVFFVVRLMISDTWTHAVAHWAMLTTAGLLTGLSLLSQSNALSSLAFALASGLVTVVHFILEAIRFETRSFETASDPTTTGRARTIMQYAVLKPDMAILLVALILAFYAITSHSLIVIPTLLALMYIIKTIAELINLRTHHKHLDTMGLLITCVIVDFVYSVFLWRYIIGEFLARTLVATWYLQELLLLVVVMGAAVYTALLMSP